MAGSVPFRRSLFFVGMLGLLAALVVAVAPVRAAAAVVHAVRTAEADAGTRIVVEIEGEFRYRTQVSEDGGSLLVDIADADLAGGVRRFLPVASQQVDGVIVLEDAGARIVRVSVDAAGQAMPGYRTTVGTRGLEVSLGSTPAAATTQGGAAAWSRSTSPGPQALPASSRRAVLERPLVVLDPGHGGKDPGARAWTGEYEKDIVLDLARRVARRLRKGGQFDVVMTRSGDRYVTLEDRRDFSRQWNADVFVSVHANASHSAKARGVETYYHSRSGGSSPDGRTDRETRRLARIENAGRADERRQPGRPGLTPVSTGRATAAGPVRDRSGQSRRLAELVQGELVRRLGMRYETVRDLGAKEGPFFVIGDNAAPSVLVEAAFLTHREEGLRMRSEVFREQIADGVARGIRAFLEEQQPGAL